jgi:Xaa-Pro aminopeptidase
MLTVPKPSGSAVPFDTSRLDRLMEEAGIDVLLASSKHNVQYLLGGHRAFFFDYMDAMGLSRYLPVFVYPKGAPEKAAYFGHRLEGFQKENDPFWVGEAQTNSSGSVDAIQKAIDHIRRSGAKARRIGAELAFLPVDAGTALRNAFPDSEITDALFVLERMRARKSPDELRKLRVASEAVIDSMLAVIATHGPGTTKRELTEALRREETNRGLIFEYCLITAGTSLNRAPSEQRWEAGDILSLDSGGNYHGYIGDLCRMAIQGEPDGELADLLGEIETIQRAAMKPIKAGRMGGDIYAAADPLVRQSKQHNHMHFLAHGMGLVSHEAPRLTASGPVPYDAYDASRPLETGMVVSVETTLAHPRRGFIKLEDTVVVTDSGFEIFGEGGRGWNRGGTAAAA